MVTPETMAPAGGFLATTSRQVPSARQADMAQPRLDQAGKDDAKATTCPESSAVQNQPCFGRAVGVAEGGVWYMYGGECGGGGDGVCIAYLGPMDMVRRRGMRIGSG